MRVIDRRHHQASDNGTTITSSPPESVVVAMSKHWNQHRPGAALGDHVRPNWSRRGQACNPARSNAMPFGHRRPTSSWRSNRGRTQLPEEMITPPTALLAAPGPGRVATRHRGQLPDGKEISAIPEDIARTVGVRGAASTRVRT
jgi:hypothetical protein